MNRFLTATIAAASVLLGASITPSFAGVSGTAASTSANQDAGAATPVGNRGHHGMQEMRNATPEERAVVRSLMQLQRVYLNQGRVNDFKPLLDNVKRKTSNVTISAFVDRQLDRIAKRPANADQQIATLTQQLNDNIAKLQ